LIIFAVMDCKNCSNSNCIKKGKRNGKQRYFCKNCNFSFQLDYRYNAYKPQTNTLIKNLLKEGCGVRSISRIMNISSKTVLSRMLKISKRVKAPYFNTLGCKFEIDEMWTYIKRKKRFHLDYLCDRKGIKNSN